MGKQIEFYATNHDELEFLSYLRTTADIALLETSGQTKESLWVPIFCAERRGHRKYYIWNRAFPWTPTFGRVGAQSIDPATVGWYFVSNSGDAPLVEFSRSQPEHPGRIYWSKHFTAPYGLKYDVPAFERWYNSAARWVRKHGQKHKGQGAYYMPSAWEALKRNSNQPT